MSAPRDASAPAIVTRRVIEHGLDGAAAVLDRGFSDYFVKIPFTAATLMGAIRNDGVDVAASLVAFDGDDPVAVALMARRGWTSRLAGMAVVPEARGRRVGRRLVERLLDEARGRGERAMVLEVIEQNAPAVALYRACGFDTLGRLVSLQRDPAGAAPSATDADGLDEVDVREVARALVAHTADDLPWQVSGETLVQSGPPTAGYRLGDAWAAVSDPSAATIVVRAIVTRPEARHRGHARALVRALAARFPDRAWRVPALCPESAAGPFEREGWTRGEMSQLHMRRAL